MFATQHQQAEATLPHGSCQHLPETRAGCGGSHVVEHDRLVAGQRVGLAIELRGGNHGQRPAAVDQAACQGPGRPLHIQDGRARCDVDQRGIGQGVKHAAGGGGLQGHVHPHCTGAVGIDGQRCPASIVSRAAGYPSLSTQGAGGRLDPQGPIPLSGQLHTDVDALAGQRALRCQHLRDAGGRRRTADSQPLQWQPGRAHGIQRARRITHVFEAVGDDDGAGIC